jgi:hypothetical protein
MKITNHLKLPQALLRFADKHSYDPGDSDFTASSLIEHPRITRLKAIHRDEMSDDISNMVMSLVGTAWHAIAADGAAPNDIVEERIFTHISGAKVSGAIDLQVPSDGGIKIIDYKTTSAISVMMNPGGKDSWEQQLNIYAELVERVKGVEVTELEVVILCRDWTRAQVARSKTYPKSAVVSIPVWLWDKSDRKKFLEERVQLHLKYFEEFDLPECTPEDRWENRFAVHEMKLDGSPRKNPKTRSATRGKAEAYINKNDLKATIIEGDSKRTRCEENYCGVADFCNQWKGVRDDE